MTTFSTLLEQAEEFKRTGQHDRALGVLTYMLDGDPNGGAGLNAATLLSSVYKDLGRMDRAYEFMHKVVVGTERLGLAGACGSAYASLACGALYTHGVTLRSYTDITERVDIYMNAAIPKVSHLMHDFNPDRALRVGILSPDFCLHSLAYLVVQPLINFERATPHKLYLYHLRSTTDSVTNQMKEHVTKFVNVHGKSDADIVKEIVDDKIDVLIDLSGYTAETRLSVFCRQPAPVQMGWISGMMTPTGLSCIPYFLTDTFMKPDEVPTELCTPIVGKTALTYHTLRDKELDIGGLPSDRNGHINFVSFNNPCKINNDVLSAWARILTAVPKSKLHLKTYSPLDTSRIHHFLTSARVDPSRLVLMPALPSPTDVQLYYGQNADIFLDAWPCSGCLTTVEALWMGVPVVSYYQDVFCSRQSHAILNQIGVTDLSHSTVDGYVEAAVSLAQNRQRMAELRRTLRDRIVKSPLRNYAAMAADLGSACVTAWKQTILRRKETLDLLRKAA